MSARTSTLCALAVRLNVEILMTLSDSPRSASDLLAAVGDPPRSTAHKRLRELTDLGALHRSRQRRFPRQVNYELTPDGEQMLDLAASLERWLAGAPDGRATLGTQRAKRMIDVLVAGWKASIVSTLVDRPHSLTELDRLVDTVPYPSLERRLVALREMGLVRVASTAARGTPYEVTEWLRRAAAPLLAAAAFEVSPADDINPRPSEVRAGLLLAMPLLRLPGRSEGTLVIAIVPDQTNGKVRKPDGATLKIRGGRVAECIPKIDESAPTWALGTPGFWLDAALTGEIDRLRIGGRTPQLGADLATGVHHSLFMAERDEASSLSGADPANRARSAKQRDLQAQHSCLARLINPPLTQS
jgi:DNA-binding HxlR family transcriptional regulator